MDIARLLRQGVACVPLVLLAGAVQAAVVSIDLRAEAVLAGARMVLSDLATVTADDAALARKFAAVAVGGSPMAGQIERRSRAELEVALLAQPFAPGHRIVWQGAPAVTVRRESRAMDPALPLAEALRYVRAQYGTQHAALDATLAAPLAQLALPPGHVLYRARAVDGQPLRSRMAVWVDVLVDGVLYRPVAVPLLVVAHEEVYVARRALEAGEALQAADVAPAVRDVALLPDAPLSAKALAAAPRLRGALAQGQVVTARQVAPAGMVLRGDVVTVQMRHGAIVLEARAVAQADAQAGQMVAVRIRQDSEAVAAKVLAPGLVQIDGR